MPNISDAGRQAGHIILDMLTAFDLDGADEATNAAAMNLAFRRMNEVDAVIASRDDETDELHLDISPLLGGAVLSLQYLIHQLELYAEADRNEIIVKIREFLDSQAEDG